MVANDIKSMDRDENHLRGGSPQGDAPGTDFSSEEKLRSGEAGENEDGGRAENAVGAAEQQSAEAQFSDISPAEGKPDDQTENREEKGHLADLQRLQAEYVNYRRRVERDRDVARETAVQGMVASLLPVLDDIDAARRHGDLDGGPFAAIAQKLDDTLAKHGVSRYGEAGVVFDPTIYEALVQQPSPEVNEETVSQVLRPGYRMGERIIRAAQVAVSVPE